LYIILQILSFFWDPMQLSITIFAVFTKLFTLPSFQNVKILRCPFRPNKKIQKSFISIFVHCTTRVKTYVNGIQIGRPHCRNCKSGADLHLPHVKNNMVSGKKNNVVHVGKAKSSTNQWTGTLIKRATRKEIHKFHHYRILYTLYRYHVITAWLARNNLLKRKAETA
jgi:hypothetical protein